MPDWSESWVNSQLPTRMHTIQFYREMYFTEAARPRMDSILQFVFTNLRNRPLNRDGIERDSIISL
ncbi:hypothetical protein EYF80_007129 [Liparis tanakae]|uniref:Uncharacterized protein n=1 Tax=Liparis tanakae TaxID=230148 RepID=A0A4Z2IXX0_9TELE|nr:hypothetical protein EYF80_007129 [Liparis tanakae]